MESNVFKIKFGKMEHLFQMQKEGLIYFNSIKYFADIEDGGLRGDKNESAYEFETYKDHILYIKPLNDPNAGFTKLNATWGQKVIRNNEPTGNLFCLYTVSLDINFQEGRLQLDERVKEFGSYGLIIKNTPEFISRVFSKLESQNIPHCAGYVEYLDLKYYSGKKTLFQKDLAYKYQQEYRIYLKTNKQEPFKLQIGDISDISSIYEYDVIKRLTFKRL